MTLQLDDALALLERTPPTLARFLGGSAPALHRANEGPDTWSPFDVVRHLVCADETSWIPRARTILEHGGSRPFPPSDPQGDPARFDSRTIDEVLALFAQVREESLRTVRGWNLTSGDLELPGLHPQLGPVTLGQLFASWSVHDLTHITQIARVMAKQYAGDVGAWREFLPIVER